MNSILEYDEEVEKVLKARKVILFGTGGNFHPIADVLSQLKIKVLAICDNNKALQGKEIEAVGIEKNYKFPVLSVEETYKKFGGELPWIITSANEISIRNMNKQLKNIGISGGGIDGISILYYGGNKRGNSINNYIRLKDALILPNIALVVTDYCTLKCKDCQFMIGKKRIHQHYSLVECITAVVNLAKNVDIIGRIGITGGEALNYPGLKQLIKELCEIDNILTYEVMTNGATTLSDEIAQILKESRTRLTVSDYGILSRKKKEILVQREKWGFQLNVRSQDKTWNKLGDAFKRNRKTEENEKLYFECPFGGGCPVILDGKLAMCGHAAFLMQGRLIPEDEQIDLLDKNVDIYSEMKRLLSLRSIEACDYCDGIYGEKILAALQQ